MGVRDERWKQAMESHKEQKVCTGRSGMRFIVDGLCPSTYYIFCFGGFANVAQSAEQLIRNQRVGSSNLPVGSFRTPYLNITS